MQTLLSDYPSSLLNQFNLKNVQQSNHSHLDLFKFEQNYQTTHPFNTNYNPSDEFHLPNNLLNHLPSAKPSSLDSSYNLHPSWSCFSAESRPSFSFGQEIQPNLQCGHDSLVKDTPKELPKKSFVESQIDLQSIHESDLRADLELDWISHQSALNRLDFSPDGDTLKSFEELFPQDHNTFRSCSSCGILKPQSELSHLRPCLHPHCNTCINTLINSSCNDPPPPHMVCFLCSQPVTGFDLPAAFELSQNKFIPSNPSRGTNISSIPNVGSYQSTPSTLDSVDINSPSDDPFGLQLTSLESGRRTALFDEKIPTLAPESPLLFNKSYSPNSNHWPLVRVDNISWSLTVADILKWLPDGSKYLPPPELCPLPIHILCNPTDGKTLNYCFIEMRNLSAAQFLVRHRHASKIRMRPCSVVLTSISELYSNLLGVQTDVISQDVMKTVQLILKLCDPHNNSSIKAPERAFFHLVSLLSHYKYLSDGRGSSSCLDENGLIRIWTGILQVAIESLLSGKYDITESINILHIMVDVGISSPFIDKVALFQFLSQVEVSFNQISRKR